MTRNLGVTRIVIVEDHTLFAESLDVALTFEGHDVHRVAPGAEGQETAAGILAAVLRLSPRVVLLDLGLGGAGDGLGMVGPLTRSGVSVVVVTGSSDRVVWGDCLRAGALTVVSKSLPLNAILSTMRHIGDGRAVMPRVERDELMVASARDRWELHEQRRRLATLTPRERQVLGHLMHGRSVREIAVTGFVSEATVRTQVKAILSKLQVSSQLAAVSVAHRAG